MNGAQAMSAASPAAPLSADTGAWPVSLMPLVDRAALAREWRVLEQTSRASFFLSWDWMGALLDSAEGIEAPLVMRVGSGPTPKGLALLWRGRQRRHGLVRSRSLHLNETGRPEFDRITMEHNGVLAAAADEAAVLRAAVGHLASCPGWDECYLSGLDDSVLQAVADEAAQHPLWHRRRWTKSYHFVNLDDVRQHGGDYLDSLSANTRYQARRAIKGYAALGALQCRRAASTEEALDWFQDLARLHQAHWGVRGEPGAFSSGFTRRFHATLIAQGWARGVVSMLRVTAGAELLGYVYNFERDGTASNYQSGHVTGESSKLKPGLVVHCLAVQDALQRGLRSYDLLMGGDHFKPSLCNASGHMSWSVLQQRRLVLGIENRVRQARDRWQARRKQPASVQVAGAEGTP